MYTENRNRLTDIENLWLPKGRENGLGQIRGMVLMVTNYYI